MAVLCRPTFLVFAALCVVVLPWFVRTWRERSKVFLSCTAGVLIVLAPWMARNAVQLGRPVIGIHAWGLYPAAGQQPLVLRHTCASRPGAKSGSRTSSTPGGRRRLQRPSLQSEVARDRFAYDRALENIRREPAMFARASLVRVGPTLGTGAASAARCGEPIDPEAAGPRWGRGLVCGRLPAGGVGLGLSAEASPFIFNQAGSGASCWWLLSRRCTPSTGASPHAGPLMPVSVWPRVRAG